MYEQNNNTITDLKNKPVYDHQEIVENALIVRSHEIFGLIRALIKNGVPYFVAKDVAVSLGYSNTRTAIARHCKLQVTVPKQDGGFLTIIPERDLYRLVMRSKLPAAEKFEEWVVGEVLPSVRKNGFYGTDRFIEDALANPSNMITILKKYQSERQQRQEAEQQRDHAVATKAEISRRREATAMNTASHLSKENTRLKERIGDSRTWKKVIAIPWLEDFFNLDKVAYAQIGKRLTKESKNLGLEIRQVEHTRYGKVKAYHSDAIEHFRHKLIEDRNLMKKYRKYSQGDN